MSIRAAYDEYFTCDDEGDTCDQDYEFITNQASRFNVAAAGVAISLTVAAAHQDGFDNYSIYRDTGGKLVPDASHLVWFSGYNPVPISSTALSDPGFDIDGRASLDTYALGNLALGDGDYWITISVNGPTIGYEPVLFAGTNSGTNAKQAYFDNETGPFEYRNFDGLQASVRLDGTLSAVPGVPEPATWSLLVAGFGIIGATIRRRKSAASNEA